MVDSIYLLIVGFYQIFFKLLSVFKYGGFVFKYKCKNIKKLIFQKSKRLYIKKGFIGILPTWVVPNVGTHAPSFCDGVSNHLMG